MAATTERVRRQQQVLALYMLYWALLLSVFFRAVHHFRTGQPEPFLTGSDLLWGLGAFRASSVIALWVHAFSRVLLVRASGLRLIRLNAGSPPAIIKTSGLRADIRIGVTPFSLRVSYDSGRLPATVARRVRILRWSGWPNLVLAIAAVPVVFTAAPNVAGASVGSAVMQLTTGVGPWVDRRPWGERAFLRESRPDSDVLDLAESARIGADNAPIEHAVEQLRLALSTDPARVTDTLYLRSSLVKLLTLLSDLEGASQGCRDALEVAAANDPRVPVLVATAIQLRLLIALRGGVDLDPEQAADYRRRSAGGLAMLRGFDASGLGLEVLLLLAAHDPESAAAGCVRALTILERRPIPLPLK